MASPPPLFSPMCFLGATDMCRLPRDCKRLGVEPVIRSGMKRPVDELAGVLASSTATSATVLLSSPVKRASGWPDLLGRPCLLGQPDSKIGLPCLGYLTGMKPRAARPGGTSSPTMQCRARPAHCPSIRVHRSLIPSHTKLACRSPLQSLG
jgi:hypothetical protein